MSVSRSRVMPGRSCVSARRLPARRLKSVDLPTFGPADDHDLFQDCDLPCDVHQQRADCRVEEVQDAVRHRRACASGSNFRRCFRGTTRRKRRASGAATIPQRERHESPNSRVDRRRARPAPPRIRRSPPASVPSIEIAPSVPTGTRRKRQRQESAPSDQLADLRRRRVRGGGGQRGDAHEHRQQLDLDRRPCVVRARRETAIAQIAATPTFENAWLKPRRPPPSCASPRAPCGCSRASSPRCRGRRTRAARRRAASRAPRIRMAPRSQPPRAPEKVDAARRSSRRWPARRSRSARAASAARRRTDGRPGCSATISATAAANGTVRLSSMPSGSDSVIAPRRGRRSG